MSNKDGPSLYPVAREALNVVCQALSRRTIRTNSARTLKNKGYSGENLCFAEHAGDLTSWISLAERRGN